MHEFESASYGTQEEVGFRERGTPHPFLLGQVPKKRGRV